MRVLRGILTAVALLLALPVNLGLVALGSMFVDSGYPSDRPWGVLMLLTVAPLAGLPVTGAWLVWRSHRPSLGMWLLGASVAVSGVVGVLVWTGVHAAATP